jgi:hypothetical protein
MALDLIRLSCHMAKTDRLGAGLSKNRKPFGPAEGGRRFL